PCAGTTRVRRMAGDDGSSERPGVVLPLSLTIDEVANEAVRALDPLPVEKPLRALAAIATEAFFVGSTDSRSASQAWVLEREVRRTLYPGTRSWSARAKYWLNPRPVLRSWRIDLYRRRVLRPLQTG